VSLKRITSIVGNVVTVCLAMLGAAILVVDVCTWVLAIV